MTILWTDTITNDCYGEKLCVWNACMHNEWRTGTVDNLLLFYICNIIPNNGENKSTKNCFLFEGVANLLFYHDFTISISSSNANVWIFNVFKIPKSSLKLQSGSQNENSSLFLKYPNPVRKIPNIQNTKNNAYRKWPYNVDLKRLRK